jgi:hypothetical protein
MDIAEMCGLVDGDFTDVNEDESETIHENACQLAAVEAVVKKPRHRRPIKKVPKKAPFQARLRGLHRVDRIIFWSEECCAMMKGGIFFPEPNEAGDQSDFDKTCASSISTALLGEGLRHLSAPGEDQAALAAFNHVIMLLPAENGLGPSSVAMVLTAFANLIGLVTQLPNRSKLAPVVASKAVSFVAAAFSQNCQAFANAQFSQELLELYIALAIVNANSGDLKQCISMCDLAIAAAGGDIPKSNTSCEDLAEAYLTKATAQFSTGESQAALETLREGAVKSCTAESCPSRASISISSPAVAALRRTLKTWEDYRIPESLFETNAAKLLRPVSVQLTSAAARAEERAASVFSRTYQSALIFHSDEQQALLPAAVCRYFIAAAEQHAHAGWETNGNPTDVGRVSRTKEVQVNHVLGGALLPFFHQALAERLLPWVASCFQVLGKPSLRPLSAGDIRVHQAFIVRYDGEGGQASLPLHRDQSVVSFTIALNTCSEYAGGGTYFTALGRAVNVEQGHALLFAGGLEHAGACITQGKRYILVIFLAIHDHPLALHPGYWR